MTKNQLAIVESSPPVTPTPAALAAVPEEQVWLASQKSARTRRAYRQDVTRGYSAHSMRATFITTALENGASLEDVQKAAGHRDPSTTKLYDRRGYNPEKSASLFGKRLVYPGTEMKPGA